MNVWLEGNVLMRGDLLVRWVQRSDLVPIPRTVELTVRLKDGIEEKIKEGESFHTGVEKLKYRVVKTVRHDPAGFIQGSDQMQVMTATAVLEPLHRVAFRQPRAVIKENSTFGDIYMSCGADMGVEFDLPVERFACYTGQVPTFHIAQALQEECATVVLKSKMLRFMRLPDLFKQDPKFDFGPTDSSALEKSGFLERNQIPAYYSVTPTGQVIHGDLPTDTRSAQFIPRTGERILRNLSRVLVVRHVIPAALSEILSAGDCVTVGGKKMVVITAAHVMSKLESGISDTFSRFWVGELNK